MADNVVLNSGSGGATVRTLEDASGVQHPVGVTAYATTIGTPDVIQIVTPSAGLPVQPQTSSTWIVVGAAAHDAAALGNPVLAAGYASASAPTSVADGDACRLWVTAAGALNIADGGGTLSVDDGGGALTVDGTVAATQSGTWTVTGAGGTFPVTDSGGSLTVDAPVGTPVFVRLSDGSSAIATLPVSMASVPSHDVTNAGTFAVQISAALPAGANAIGKLAANSGVDIGDVDVASVTPGTGVANLGKAEDAAHSSGDVGVFVLGVRRDSPISGVSDDGDYCTFNFDSSGRLHATVGNTVTVTGTLTVTQATAGNLNCTEASAATIATNTGNAATSLAILDDWDESDRAKVNPIVGQAGVAAGSGAVGATVQRVTLASDDPAVTALQLLDDAIFTDDAAYTPGTSKLAVIGAQADETSTDSVDEGDAGALRMTLNRQLVVTTKPTATGEGCDVFRSLDVDETEEDVKTSAGMLYGYFFSNLHATNVLYLKFYNATAANVTVGTTPPFLTFPLPAASSGHIAFTHPIKFDTAISVAATTGLADNNAGAPGANEVVLNAFYK